MLERKLQISFILASVIYLVSLIYAPYTGQFLVKVLPIIILFISCIYFLPGAGKVWIGIGVIASGTGDVLLALPINNSFLFGLSAFFVAQIVYAISFYKFRQGNKKTRPTYIVMAALFIYAVLMGNFILPFTGELLIPVSAYLTVITLMGVSALWSSLNWKVMAGALFFIASDTALALSIFKTPLPFSSYIVMFTYYAAQLLIVFGMIDSQKSLR